VWWHALFILMVSASGCLPATPKLDRATYAAHRATDAPSKGYRVSLADVTPADDTLFLVTLSGGGTRAAAFAYGALRELDATHRANGRTLLDEVDLISSVSGGSFAAAYLALNGKDRFLTTFPAAVLHRQLQLGFGLRILNPLNWPRLLSPRYGRGDLAGEYYSHTIFEGHTFKDLEGRRPFVVLNATDIARGAQFSFVQDHFDRLCADLGPVPIGRAVAASSAFPIVFTPLTVENHPKETCGYVTPKWVTESEEGDFVTAPQQWDLSQTWRSYEDASGRRYIHLSDGGLADNIGLRAIESAWKTNTWDLLAATNHPDLRRIVVIVVDAKPRAPSRLDRSARPPWFGTVLNAAATTPMENYSSDTVESVRRWFDDQLGRYSRDRRALQDRCNALAASLRKEHGTPRAATRRACGQHMGLDYMQPAPDLHLIHVRFDAIADPAERTRLQGVATRLQLSAPEIEGLVTWGGRLLRESAEYQKVRQAMTTAGDKLRRP